MKRLSLVAWFKFSFLKWCKEEKVKESGSCWEQIRISRTTEQIFFKIRRVKWCIWRV